MCDTVQPRLDTDNIIRNKAQQRRGSDNSIRLLLLLLAGGRDTRLFNEMECNRYVARWRHGAS